ncbi:MAG: dihydrolipoyl dehydrogenase [Lentisphaeria bacterium]|nr:dihydrolipoyl dehydrogenase [Lentisphaeria bacterium]
MKTQLVVIGAGPAGYPAAFHAADLGMDVILIDKDKHPGGVCLYRGCIPSKALLHAANIMVAAREAEAIGITFQEPTVDMDKLRQWKCSVVDKLTGGLGQLTKARGITFIQGTARFNDARSITVTKPDGDTHVVNFEHAVIATGSVPVMPGFLPKSPRIIDSTGALALDDIPKTMLVMGGGYIGLELGQAYASLGTRVSVVEMQASLLSGVDADMVRVLSDRVKEQFEAVMLNTRLTSLTDEGDTVKAEFEKADGKPFSASYDKVLVAVGRRPVTDGLGLEKTNVKLTSEGFIEVDDRRRTAEPTILAVGDIAGQPLLAHKATHEGRSAIEALRDGKTIYDPRAIPAVVFTDPEIAWCGVTEDEARRQGMDVKIGTFPWQASGRAATLDRSQGVTKIIADAKDERVLGVGVAGHGAGELIGEGVLAIEMGAVAEDVALSIHAHPSLSETIMEAAEQVMGQSTHFFQRL